MPPVRSGTHCAPHVRGASLSSEHAPWLRKPVQLAGRILRAAVSALAGLAQFGGVWGGELGGILRSRRRPPNPCWSRLPGVSPSLPPSRPCPPRFASFPLEPLVPDWFPLRPPRLPNRPPKPPLAPNRPLPISFSLA